MRCIQKLRKIHQNPFLRGSRSFEVIDVNKFKKPITSACYDKQHVYIYLQPFSHYTSQLEMTRNSFLHSHSLAFPCNQFPFLPIPISEQSFHRCGINSFWPIKDSSLALYTISYCAECALLVVESKTCQDSHHY